MMVHIRMEKMQYFSAIRHAYDTRITLECSEKYKHIERRTYAPLRHIPTNYIPPSVPLLLLLLSLRVSPSHVFTVHRKGRNLDATNIGKGKNIIYWMATACSISSFQSKPRVTHYYYHDSRSWIMMLRWKNYWKQWNYKNKYAVGLMDVFSSASLCSRNDKRSTKWRNQSQFQFQAVDFFFFAKRWRVCVSCVRSDDAQCKQRKINFHLFVQEEWPLWLTRHEHK